MTGCQWGDRGGSVRSELSDRMMDQLGLTAPRATAQKFVSANATAAKL